MSLRLPVADTDRLSTSLVLVVEIPKERHEATGVKDVKSG